MLNLFGTSLRIGVSKIGVTLLRTNGWRQPRALVLADMSVEERLLASSDSLVEQLRNLLNEAKCSRLCATIILADDWVRYFTVTPARNTTRLQDCKASAEMRFHALYGEPSAYWQLQADWDAYRPFLVCAVPRWLLDALSCVAADCKLSIVGILPHFVAAWNQWCDGLTANAWFGVIHDEILTFGIINQQRLFAVRATPIPAGAKEKNDWLAEYVAREALLLGLAAPNHVQLCGAAPKSWLGQTETSLRCSQVDAGLPALQSLTATHGVALAITGVRL